MKPELPGYIELHQALRDVGAAVGAAEAQGMLCGMLSSTAETTPAGWIAQVLDGTEPKGEPARRCLELLALTFQVTQAGLDDSNLDFRLMLPPDDAELPELAEALGAWAGGYLYGLGSVRPGADADLPPDVREALASLAEIARVDDEAAAEADREAFEEVVEFLRVAVLLVREQLRPSKRREPVDVKQPHAKGRTLH
ncbi:MAG: UPF0149 family protein [Ectothiorhodospiraceae bacterium]|nr:UPF0149 family protein [Ectothiorhodospiraceae bacterium]